MSSLPLPPLKLSPGQSCQTADLCPNNKPTTQTGSEKKLLLICNQLSNPAPSVRPPSLTNTPLNMKGIFSSSFLSVLAAWGYRVKGRDQRQCTAQAAVCVCFQWGACIMSPHPHTTNTLLLSLSYLTHLKKASNFSPHVWHGNSLKVFILDMFVCRLWYQGPPPPPCCNSFCRTLHTMSAWLPCTVMVKDRPSVTLERHVRTWPTSISRVSVVFQQSPTELIVLCPVPRSGPRNMRVYDPTTTTLSVSWEHADGPVVQYRITYAPTTGDPIEEYVSMCLCHFFTPLEWKISKCALIIQIPSSVIN